MKVAPSIIAADFSKFQEEIRKVEDAGADLIHLDIMDGVFVPNITFGPMIVEAIDRISGIQLDAHLMIVHPEYYLTRFMDAGADWISFHAEASEKIDECMKVIKERDKKVGLALSPPTPFVKVRQYIERLDYLLIMTVNPGFYGQQFITDTLKKIEEVKEWITLHQLDCLIQVDGGINDTNAAVVCQAGVDIVVAGAGIFKSADYSMAIEKLRCSKV